MKTQKSWIVVAIGAFILAATGILQVVLAAVMGMINIIFTIMATIIMTFFGNPFGLGLIFGTAVYLLFIRKK